MAINHPVYLQRAEKGPLGKVTLIAVVDAESVGMKDTDDCVWMMATTTPSSMYTGHNPSISLEIKSKMSSEDYVNGLNKSTGQWHEHTRGMGITGILKSPYWFIRKFKDVLEMMGG